MKIYSQGDQAIVVSIEKEVSQDLTEDLLALKDYFVAHDYPFITEIVPTESDIMICYDARDMIKHHNINSPFKYMKDLIESIQLEIRHVLGKVQRARDCVFSQTTHAMKRASLPRRCHAEVA